MGMLSALIDVAIDNTPFPGHEPLSEDASTRAQCPICKKAFELSDLDSHVFTVHRHGLLLHSAEGDGGFRKALQQRHSLSPAEADECHDFCMFALGLYSSNNINWNMAKQLAGHGGGDAAICLKQAFIELLYLVYSEDVFSILPIARYEALKRIYPHLRGLKRGIGVAARSVVEIYFDWYQCIRSSKGPFHDAARLFGVASTGSSSADEADGIISRLSIDICMPNQMIEFIRLASEAVTIERGYSHAVDLLDQAIAFHQSCNLIYKPKAYYLAVYLSHKAGHSRDLKPEHPSHARLVELYGLGGGVE